MRFRSDQIQRGIPSVFATEHESLADQNYDILVESGIRIVHTSKSYYYGSHLEFSYPLSCFITPEGRTLVNQNHGLLSVLDGLLLQLTTSETETECQYRFKNDSELSLNRLETRKWSLLFKMIVNKQPFIVKARNLESAGEFYDIWQPFNHELIQVLHLQNVFHEELKRNMMRLPQYLFTSPHVCIRHFEEGTYPNSLKRSQIDCLINMNDWVRGKRLSRDPLWKCVYFDVFEDSYEEILRPSNLIQSSDGSITIIDPFFSRFSNIIK